MYTWVVVFWPKTDKIKEAKACNIQMFNNVDYEEVVNKDGCT
jgi:hypothetical protein